MGVWVVHVCIFVCISYYTAACAIYQILALYDVRALGPLAPWPYTRYWRCMMSELSGR